MKVGLALAGGGIRGIAHAGALKALEELKIPIDVIGRGKFRKPYMLALCTWNFTILYICFI